MHVCNVIDHMANYAREGLYVFFKLLLGIYLLHTCELY